MIRSRSSWDEGGEALREARPRMKQEFAKLAWRLNEKKFELTQAEKQFQNEAR